jgi:hypothetical protein
MIFEIYDPNKKKEPKLSLMLTEFGDDVCLCVVDEEGLCTDDDVIAVIQKDGSLRINCEIRRDLGLLLDSDGGIHTIRA